MKGLKQCVPEMSFTLRCCAPCKFRGGAPMMKNAAMTGKFEFKGENYVRLVKNGPVFKMVPTSISVDVSGNLKEPQFTLREISAACCESVLSGRPEPFRVDSLPGEYFAIGTIPVDKEASRVLGVGYRDNDGVSFHTAEHLSVASAGGLRLFKKFGGKFVDVVDNVVFKRGSDSNPDIKGTGWDHIVFTFKDESVLKKTCADLGITKAKRYDQKSSGFFEMFGATDEGFWKTKGSLLPQSASSKFLGVLQHNASSFGGFSGALMRNPGTGEGIGMHICGFKAFNQGITVPALIAFRPPAYTMKDILNSVSESTTYGEDQTGFELDRERAEIEESMHALNTELVRTFDEQITEWGIQGAPLKYKEAKRWVDYEMDPEDEADLLLYKEALKKKRAELNEKLGKPPGLPEIKPPSQTLRERLAFNVLREECTINMPVSAKNEAAAPSEEAANDECCMMGAALNDSTQRFWAEFEGDVPPKEPPMRFDGETINNARMEELIRDFLVGGRKAAQAQLVLNKCFPDAKTGEERVKRLLELDVVKNNIGPYVEKTSFLDIGDNAILHKDKNGEIFFRQVGTYKHLIPKNAKTQDSCFDDEWQAKLRAGGFGGLVDDVIPANTKPNIIDSMCSQSARQHRTSPKMTPAALAAFLKCKSTYSSTVPPIYQEEKTGEDLPAGWERVLGSLQNKSSGWSNRYRAATKSTWAKEHSPELRKLVSIRMLLRSAAGASMATMTPMQMLVMFLADPKEIFLKAERHSGAKRRGKRWRMIWISSVLDTVCQGLTSYNQNKRDIYDYQVGAKTVHGAGVGHHHEGIKLLMKQIESFAGTQTVESSDASGWDLSVARLAILLDAERRAQCVKNKESDSDDENHEIRLAASLSFYTDAFANSAHSLSFKGMVFVCEKYGITATGTLNTTSQNSFMRSFILFVAGAEWALSVGDDENHTGEVDKAILAEWGVITKEGSEGEGTANDFAMLSHDYKKDACGRCYAEYTNVEKMISTNALKVARGEPIHPQVVGGQLYVLRDSPQALELYKKAAELCGWPFEVDDDFIKYDEELVCQL